MSSTYVGWDREFQSSRYSNHLEKLIAPQTVNLDVCQEIGSGNPVGNVFCSHTRINWFLSNTIEFFCSQELLSETYGMWDENVITKIFIWKKFHEELNENEWRYLSVNVLSGVNFKWYFTVGKKAFSAVTTYYTL